MYNFGLGELKVESEANAASNGRRATGGTDRLDRTGATDPRDDIEAMDATWTSKTCEDSRRKERRQSGQAATIGGSKRRSAMSSERGRTSSSLGRHPLDRISDTAQGGIAWTGVSIFL